MLSTGARVGFLPLISKNQIFSSDLASLPTQNREDGILPATTTQGCFLQEGEDVPSLSTRNKRESTKSVPNCGQRSYTQY